MHIQATHAHTCIHTQPPSQTHTQAPSDGTHGPVGHTPTHARPARRPATPACVPALPRSSCVSVLGPRQQAWGSCPPSRPSPSSAAPTGGVTKARKPWKCGGSGFCCSRCGKSLLAAGAPELKQVEQPHSSSPGLSPFPSGTFSGERGLRPASALSVGGLPASPASTVEAGRPLEEAALQALLPPVPCPISRPWFTRCLLPLRPPLPHPSPGDLEAFPNEGIPRVLHMEGP